VWTGDLPALRKAKALAAATQAEKRRRIAAHKRRMTEQKQRAQSEQEAARKEERDRRVARLFNGSDAIRDDDSTVFARLQAADDGADFGFDEDEAVVQLSGERVSLPMPPSPPSPSPSPPFSSLSVLDVDSVFVVIITVCKTFHFC
jgi:hypothetical protein